MRRQRVLLQFIICVLFTCLGSGARVAEAACNAWSAAGSMPTARDSLTAATGPDGRIYAMGGYTGSAIINTVEAYDPSTNTWSSVASMPTPRYGLAAAAGPDGRIYAMGGHDCCTIFNTVEAYNPSANTWSSVAPMPTPRHYLAAATGVGADGVTRIFAIGGSYASILNTVQAYNPSTNTWSSVASMPTPRYLLAAATGADGRIYVIGGYNGGARNTVEVYNPSSNTWSTAAPMPTARFGLAAAAGSDGRIYAMGGTNGSAIINTVEAYNPSTNTWSSVASMPTPRYLLAAATEVGADGLTRFYAIGGTYGGELNTVDAYAVCPVTTDFFNNLDQANAMAIQPDGKIVLAGFAHNSSNTDQYFALARYNPDGSLDTTFGTGGKVTTDFHLGYAGAVALQSDGKIVAAGSTVTTATGYDFALARYNPDGSLDTTFGTGGKVTTDFFNDHDGAAGVAIQSDGKIVAAGAARNSTPTDVFALARYNPDGSLDTTFGPDHSGKVTTSFFASSDDGASAVAIQSDGKIVAAGSTLDFTHGSPPNSYFALARYNPDGSLDTTFGPDQNGKVTTGPFFSSGSSDRANAVALQSDGKIVVGGVAFGSTGGDFALARYNPGGSLDTTFGTGGKVTTDFHVASPDAEDHDQVNALAIQSDGAIVAAGFVERTFTDQDFALARYNPDGSLDTSFGTGGKVTTDFFDSEDRANALALQADGTIVAAGYVRDFNTGRYDFALVRYPAPNPTPAGTDVKVQSGAVTITFSTVTAGGTTTVTRIDPSSAGAVPGGYAVLNNLAFEITTTATYTAPIQVCFTVPSVTDPAAFSNLKIFHNEGGVLVDRTVSGDFSSKTICAQVTSLSPFVVAQSVDTTAPVVTVKAKPSSLKNGSGTVSVVISGTITDSGSGVDPTTAHYRVTDTEGTVQPSGSVTLSSKGTYSFAVQLDAIQIKKRSRLYKVYVSAADRVGNVGTGNLAIPVN